MSDVKTRQRAGTYQRGEDTRRRILDAALAAFAADGYEGVSTRALAEQAGVNLPAIQYYFGSKEGLYRAVIEWIARGIEECMAPVAARVREALMQPDLPHKQLLALLHEVLDAFVSIVNCGENLESRRMLFARAEIEREAPLDPLHETGRRQVFEPCAALIARLIGQPLGSEEVLLRTLMIVGEVVIFCNKGARRELGATALSEDRVLAIQALVREHTAAIFRATKGMSR